MDHLGDAVEDLDLARDDAALTRRIGPAQGILVGVEMDDQEFGHGVADVDAVGAAARGGRLVQADLDLDGRDARQGRLADRGAQAAVGAGDGQGEQQMGGAFDVEIGEKLRGLRPDPVERGQVREERKQDLGAAHGRHGA